ncbi:hypothetical protein RFI_13343 [Reticulomyxa filosa]|uniref:Uncharacterized protein n=1 Tax=Reticulomyxa filosa TaxID=46433 RepID=X6NEQ6_RETFI|nr:hypothetical protein RFI_13343 [Reticulomyxa filosa]|eukprot:ETO23822.1 hypothetical protein RFI_13343 [Reticulomyxa filosa]
MDSIDTNVEQNADRDMQSPFETLTSLPRPFSQAQCVVHKHEILICGGFQNNECYSYHTIKEQYKHICSYPKEMLFSGHTVVSRVEASSSRAITLLSFGGHPKHTLVMKYVSVWENDKDDSADTSDTEKIKDWNQWLPLTDNQNNRIQIGRNGDNYFGVRAVIGGSENNLLFITYRPSNIDIFNLDTLQYINHYTFPYEKHVVFCHCFVSIPENKVSTMILFSEKTGLSIEYDEDTNTFEFYKLWVCTNIRPFKRYAYVNVNQFIFFLVDGMKIRARLLRFQMQFTSFH